MREDGWGRELAIETIQSIIASKRKSAARRRKMEVARQGRPSEAREPQSVEMQGHTSSCPAELEDGAYELMDMVRTSNSCHQRSG